MSGDFSLVAIDPSLEITAVIQDAQVNIHGRDFILIGPNAKRRAEKLGLEVQVSSCNPYSSINPKSETLSEDIDSLAMRVVPGKPPSQSSENDLHFLELARLFITAVAYCQLFCEGKVTLAGIRKRLMLPLDKLKELFEVCAESDALYGLLQDCSSSLLALLNQSSEEASGGLQGAIRAVKIYSQNSELGVCASGDEFHLSQLKEKPTCLIISPEPDKMVAQGPWVGQLLGAIGEECVRSNHPRRTVTIVADEISHAGYLPTLPQMVGLYRKFGLRLLLVYQSIHQIAARMGQKVAEEILSELESVVAFGQRSYEDCERISKLAGNETVTDGSMNLHYDAEGVARKTYSGNFVSRPIIRAEDVRTLPRDRAIAILDNLPPAIVQPWVWFKDSELKAIAGKNPFYPED